MLQIGRYSMDRFVNYLRTNPEFMDRVMRLYNNFDLEAVRDFFAKLDLDAPFARAPLTHRRYIENKSEIDRIISGPDAYPQITENKGYLNDEQIKSIYGSSAGIYDELWSGAWPYEMRKEIVEWLELKEGEKVLEVGIGTGTNLQALPEYCHITGVDYCEQMLQIAREKAKALPQKRIALSLMDATSMSFPDDSFDKVLAFYTLCGARDPLSILLEMGRVCKPQGKIVIFDVIKSHIEEVAVLQYLFRPVAREMGAIYLEFSPPYVITYDAFLDLFTLLEKTKLKVEKVRASDPYATVNLIQCTNRK